MKVLIVGGGLIGVTSAYFLNRFGHEVIVLDRQAGVGREASFANGGLLTPSMAEPWNAPGCWRVLLGSLGRSDAALQLRFATLPSLFTWGIAFMRNSARAAYEQNSLSNLRLALYSRQIMGSLRAESGIEYGRVARGSLRIFREPAKLEEACVTASRRRAEGLDFRRLSSQETVALEPALEPIADRLAGAVHYAADETGDAHRFCVALAEYLRQQGVEFRLETEVSSFEMRSGRIIGVIGGGERLIADLYVVAAGCFSSALLRQVSVHLPLQPVKGYSVTLPGPLPGAALRTPIIDDDFHAAIVPLESSIRIAGTAEFAGFDATLRADRIGNLLKLLKEVLPRARYDAASVRSWSGLRPVSPDGVPVIGRTRIPNLFVNTGHGHLGWTSAAGSARLLADLVCGNAPAIDPARLSLERLTAAG